MSQHEIESAAIGNDVIQAAFLTLHPRLQTRRTITRRSGIHFGLQRHGRRREQAGIHGFEMSGNVGAESHMRQYVPFEIDTRRNLYQFQARRR